MDASLSEGSEYIDPHMHVQVFDGHGSASASASASAVLSPLKSHAEIQKERAEKAIEVRVFKKSFRQLLISRRK
jgi:serine/threonine protein phosphatase PrpC